MAFDEVENGERIKQARIKKEREDAHNTELQKQKTHLEEQMKKAEFEYERARTQKEDEISQEMLRL